MLIVHNSFIEVHESSSAVSNLKTMLTAVDRSDPNNPKEVSLYIMSGNTMMIPRGFDSFIPNQFSRTYKTSSEISTDYSKVNLQELFKLSDSVTLRDDQVIGIMKMIMNKRGIVQLATGSGKSEIMVGFLKLINAINGYYPTTIILEPTLLLVEEMVSRFESYGVKVTEYSQIRKDGISDNSGIIITHPKSLLNDLNKNDKLLNPVKIILSDEGHHSSCETWFKIMIGCINAEFSIAMSASVISPSKIPVMNLNKLLPEESLVIGATSNIIYYRNPSYYIEKGILAHPIVFRMYNPANEYVYSLKNWQAIRKRRLESPHRNGLCAQVASFFSYYGYKVLILVGTKEQAFKILKFIDDYGLSNIARCSFGSGEYWRHDTNQPVICDKSEDPMKEFSSGECKILIGTSHIYEGADIPNLDCVILASAGKKLRRVIQGIGRGIRRSKTGNYAYIIDFTDSKCPVLSRQSRLRLEMYREIIGVKNQDIYNDLEFISMKNIFSNLEKVGNKVNG